jgi:hypothetical protein
MTAMKTINSARAGCLARQFSLRSKVAFISAPE